MLRFIVLTGTHTAMLAIGFALGIYFLPILTAPAAPNAAVLQEQSKDALYSGAFSRDLEGSDFLHWGEGVVSVTPKMIVHEGSLAPGPDYKLYLTKEFVETEAAFEAIKSEAALIGDLKTFKGVIVEVPEGVDVSEYNTVLIWCESFGEFITAAKYQ